MGLISIFRAAVAIFLGAGLSGCVEVGLGLDDGWTPLHYAARSGNAGEAKRLLAGGANANAPNTSGNPPLFYAVDAGVARALIAGGALVNANGLDNFTALHCAADEGRADVVSLLLSKGADVNARLVNGGTALHEAVRIEREDRDRTAAHFQIAKLLLTRGADPYLEKYGRTALEEAARSGDRKLAALLRRSAAQHRTQRAR
jgi:ankyrin repeat protein